MPCCFVQFNDLHLCAGADADRSVAKFEAAVELALSEQRHPRPDLILLAGDLVHEATPASMALLAHCLERLQGIALLAVPGNHDYATTGAADSLDLLRAVLGDRLAQPVLLHETALLDFILVDNALADRPSDPMLEPRNALVAELLARPQAKPRLLVCHVPLVSPRDEAVLQETFGYPNWHPLEQPNRLAALAQAAAQRNHLLAASSGHLHLSGVRSEGGLRQIVGVGSLSWPHDYICYRYDEGQLDVEFIAVPRQPQWSDFKDAPLRNGIHDRRGLQRLTDSTHLTATSYLQGQPGERQSTLPCPTI